MKPSSSVSGGSGDVGGSVVRRTRKPACPARRLTRRAVLKMLAVMEQSPDSNHDPVQDFLSTGRTGRRNALPDILGQNANTSTAELPGCLQKLSANDSSMSGMSISSDAISTKLTSSASIAATGTKDGRCAGKSSTSRLNSSTSGIIISMSSGEISTPQTSSAGFAATVIKDGSCAAKPSTTRLNPSTSSTSSDVTSTPQTPSATSAATGTKDSSQPGEPSADGSS